MAREILGRFRPSVLRNIVLRGVERDAQPLERLDNVIRVVRLVAGTDCHMGLAVLQPQNLVRGQIAHDDVGKLRLKPRQSRRQSRRDKGKRCHDKLARHLVPAATQAADQLGELIISGLCHLQQILARFGRTVPARMTLKKLHAKPVFQRVDVPNDSCVVDAQGIGRTANRSCPGHVICGPNFVPSANGHSPIP